MTSSIHNRHAIIAALAALVWALTPSPSAAQLAADGSKGLLQTAQAYFTTDDARRVGTQVVAFQRVTGGWPKNINMARPMTAGELQAARNDYYRRDDSTTDNGATTMQMTFLARLYQATADTTFRNAFRRGVDYLLAGQYANGGWPQFWPVMRDYQPRITYNDDAMVNTLTLLRELAEGNEPYGGDLMAPGMKKRLRKAFSRGVDCILRTQITTDGRPTVWCQQHDEVTLAPASARAYELPSYCSMESAAIVRLLMSLPHPSKRVRRAVHSAMAWLDAHKLTGLRYDRTPNADGTPNARLVADAKAGPLWARFYDLQRAEPFVCDRDGVPRKHLNEIGVERRTGYAWYTTRPAELYPLYEQWRQRWGE